jgi:putative ABC transport system permease protein
MENFMENLFQDLRFGLRALLKNPGFALVAVITIALGIGANTAIFSVVNTVLLNPLPFPEQDKLVVVSLVNPQSETRRSGFGNADFLAVKERNQSLEKVAAYFSPRNGFNLTGGETPEQVTGAMVTADFFDVLKVNPQLGRAFFPDEDQPGKERTVVVSHKFWQNRLGANPQAVNQSIMLNNESFTVVGVMPADFRFMTGTSEFWAVMQLPPPQFRPPYYLNCIGRLKAGITQEQAQADLSAIANQLQQQYPNSTFTSVTTRTLKKAIVGDSELALLVLLGAVFFILLIASVNVANLMLARATGREKEIAIRAALGASRWRLTRQVLTESLLLAFIGGVLGLLLAMWSVDLLIALSPENLPRLEEVGLDKRVLLFTFSISMLSGLLFGLAPAIQSSRANLNATLKEGGRSAMESFGRRRLRNLLVISEFALALTLLVGAGLMIRSFLTIQKVNPGFNASNVLTMQVNLPQAKYREPAKNAAFQQQLLQRLESLPGIEAAAVSMALPPNLLIMHNPFTVEGQPPAPGEAPNLAAQLLISPDYFRTLGIRLQAGRNFSDTDNQDAPSVVIINHTMARRYFPDQDPINKRLQTGDYDPQNPYATVVGVVDDVKYSGLNEEVEPTMYTPFLQNLWWRSMYLAVRTSGAPSGFASLVRNEVWAIDRDLPVSNIKTMDQLMSESVSEPRVYTTLLGVFGALALVLASVGIYGVMSYTVTQRTHEIGIRSALGARQSDVMKLILRQGMGLALIGVGIGLAASLALTRLMETLLFGVSATDPLTFAVIALLLTGVALVACYLPARRATKVDPMVALRYE